MKWDGCGGVWKAEATPPTDSVPGAHARMAAVGDSEIAAEVRRDPRGAPRRIHLREPRMWKLTFSIDY
jgi:hypothetical protein